MKRAAIGALVLLLYAGAVALLRSPVRPLYDGVAPTLPYQWSCPPSAFAKSNQKPKPYNQSVAITGRGTEGASIQSADSQVTLILPERTFAAKAGQKAVRLRITPICATKIKGPPKTVQGNAYQIAARYVPSQEIATPSADFTVLLRYPASATDVYRLDGSSWTRLKPQTIPSSLQIYANTNKLGTFAAAGGGTNRKILWYITGGVSLVGAILGLFLGLRERRSGPAKRRN